MENTIKIQMRLQPLQFLLSELQNFLDPGLRKPHSYLNLDFKTTDLG